jgi:hypothetical protein
MITINIKQIGKHLLLISLCCAMSLTQATFSNERPDEQAGLNRHTCAFPLVNTSEKGIVRHDNLLRNLVLPADTYAEEICKGTMIIENSHEALSGAFLTLHSSLLSRSFCELNLHEQERLKSYWLHLLCHAQFKMSKLPEARIIWQFSTFIHSLFPVMSASIPVNNENGDTPFHILFRQIRCESSWARIQTLTNYLLGKFSNEYFRMQNKSGETPLTSFLMTYSFRLLPSERTRIKTLRPPIHPRIYFLIHVLQYCQVHNVPISQMDLKTIKEILPKVMELAIDSTYRNLN